jgi:pentatricopeptide repeat protein
MYYCDDRREALGLWKSRLGSGATYRALIEVFFKAGRLDYADAVCDLLKGSSYKRGR